MERGREGDGINAKEEEGGGIKQINEPTNKPAQPVSKQTSKRTRTQRNKRP